MTTREHILKAIRVVGTRGRAGQVLRNYLLEVDEVCDSFQETRQVTSALASLERVVRELREELKAIDS
jgi:hypothetical protein